MEFLNLMEFLFLDKTAFRGPLNKEEFGLKSIKNLEINFPILSMSNEPALIDKERDIIGSK